MLQIEDGAWCDDRDELRSHVVQFFKKLFTSKARWICSNEFTVGFQQMGEESLLFIIVCWKLWKRRCSILLDSAYVEQTDFLAECFRFKESIASTLIEDPRKNVGNKLSNRWKKPAENWVKANADGAMGGELGMAAAGGVLRDHHGNWIRGF
ncbi:hypothetical protein F3Y22_tig00110602pilonHSYRG00285 [Hibiscus syriacus]|uniref:Uncharacterized protein n=1 Tax=Hibiscus syriacus TaxID=106335 RepID=A0A6A3A4K7_HIBSY|nr:hypothetical protein F3Y22_tig00110602pilonHSYRG00285 [Hibiscus syriacus]